MLNWVIDETKSDKALQFLQKGLTQKYTLTVRAQIQMGSSLSKTTTECRWSLNIKDITKDGYDLELLTLENVMTETNNPALKDMVALNNVFGQMYNELHFTVNKKGQLIHVHNIAQLQKRWKQVRTQLVEIQGRHTSIEEVLRLNDDLFAEEKKLFDTINAIEFFELYFNGIYGKILPANEYITKKSRFQLADIKWAYTYTCKEPLLKSQDVYTVNVEAVPAQPFSKEWIQKAYGGFPFLKDMPLQPSASAKGVYFFDVHTGLLKEAEFNAEEIAHPGLLYTKLNYVIKADEFQKKHSKQTYGDTDSKNN